MPMLKKLKKAWTTALRKPGAKQVTQVLETRTKQRKLIGNCCLGVLCRVAGHKPKYHPIKNLSKITVTFGEGEMGQLNNNQLLETGLTTDQQHTLIRFNDRDGKTFKEIADWIDANIKVK